MSGLTNLQFLRPDCGQYLDSSKLSYQSSIIHLDYGFGLFIRKAKNILPYFGSDVRSVPNIAFMPKPRFEVAVFPESALLIHQTLLDALGQAYDIQFVAGQEPVRRGYRGAFLFGVSREEALRFSQTGLHCLAFIGGKTVSLPQPSEEIRFCAAVFLPECLQNRLLRDDSCDCSAAMKAEPGDEIVAKKGDHILWIHHGQPGSSVDLVGIPPSRLLKGDYLFNHFHRDNWMRLLPILFFLQRITGWEFPAARACFMFDDPNLHWKSYGYVDFAKIAQHSSQHNYHVSFATVPFDGWYIHCKTVALFHANRSRLSLLVHGNNHTAKELAQNDGNQALAAQALLRIERLEKKSGLEVSRVMAAPHGACSHKMATDLLRMGFEAACISRGSIMQQNPDSVWPSSFGLNQTEFLGDGMPVIPRFRLKRGCEIEIVLAAFLGQAVIPVGHHGDLADGLELLRELAGAINSTGAVKWMDMKSIARSNFCTRREGEILHLRMYSRRIQLNVPQGLSQLCVHRPWLKDDQIEGLELRTRDAYPVLFSSYQKGLIPCESCEEIEIRSISSVAIDPRSISLPQTPLRSVARRYLCEARDRLKPLFDRFLHL